jgi:hypothetical protein
MRGFSDPEIPLAQRLALAVLALAAPAILFAFCVESDAGPWIAVVAGTAFPIALMALGALRVKRLRGPLLVLWLVLTAGLLAVLALPEGGPDVLGLPAATAILIFILVPVPLTIVGLAYIATFESQGLSEEDLERIRRLAKKGGGA